ncbi:hypothetical protein GOODEAATRI_011259, partial [Goodea atripinnis]
SRINYTAVSKALGADSSVFRLFCNTSSAAALYGVAWIIFHSLSSELGMMIPADFRQKILRVFHDQNEFCSGVLRCSLMGRVCHQPDNSRILPRSKRREPYSDNQAHPLRHFPPKYAY